MFYQFSLVNWCVAWSLPTEGITEDLGVTLWANLYKEQKQMSRSMLSDYIMQEYRLKQKYANRKRENCKEKQCKDCTYFDICSNIEKQVEVHG